MLFVVLVLISFFGVDAQCDDHLAVAGGAGALAWAYPFMKRVTNLPQFVLGAAFGWGIPMGYAAVGESLPLSCWLLHPAGQHLLDGGLHYAVCDGRPRR
ncbi:UbiA family prenyltransferase [Serratia ureilytica]